MFNPIILAHGALGAWDELIFLGVAAIFLTMMGISWVRSRNTNPLVEAPDETDTPPAEENSPEHFRLD